MCIQNRWIEIEQKAVSKGQIKQHM